MEKIFLYKPYITDKEKKYVNEALDTGWISSRGKFVKEFEEKFAEKLNRKHALTTSSGTTALHLSLETLKLEKGTAVICPTLTFVASANAIRYAGLIPIFIDCQKTYVSEYDDFKKGFEIAERNSLKVSAIMPVNLYGVQTDVEKLKSFNVPIVEDCAESFGSTLNDKISGSCYSDVSCFSFFGNKIITTGEGGMIVTDDDALYNRMLMLRSIGQKPNSPQRYLHIDVGYNYRLTNIACAIGLGQLENFDWVLSQKIKLGAYYRELLDNSLFAPEPANFVGNNWMVTIMVKNNTIREGLMLYLDANGIETRPAFLPIHSMIHLGKSYRANNMSNSENVSACGINLPSYPELTKEEIASVCKHINDYLDNY